MKIFTLPLFLISISLGVVPALAVETSFETDANLPLVYVNIAFKAGAVTDPKGQSGLTNFMAEMLTRGTHKRNKEQIALALDQMGAKIEVETRAEAVIFRGAVLASQARPFLDLLEEMLTQPSFPDNEIRKLKSEIVSAVLEEMAHDQSLNSRRFNKFLFGEHPYGKPILGRTHDVGSFNETMIRAHYDRLIRSNLMLVIGSGDFPKLDIESWGEKVAQKRGLGRDSSPIELAGPEMGLSRRLLIVDKPERTQTQILVGQTGVKMDDPQFFPLHIANHAFGGPTFSSRLKVEIRVKRGWSYGAWSGFRFGTQPRLWQILLYPASKDAANALAYTLKMVQELQKDGITEQEFAFSKQSLINGAGFMYDTPAKRIENRILEKTLNLPDGLMKSYAEHLDKVTLADTNQAIRNFVKPSELSITVLATSKDLKESLVHASGEGVEVKVSPYTED